MNHLLRKLTQLNHRQRIETCLNGGIPDTIPVSLWRHFPVDDQSADQLAKSIVDFQNQFDFDFVKITPASSFCTRDWGVVGIWKGNPEGTREYINHPIKEPEDWKKLNVIDPKKGYIARQLECINLIKQQIPKTTPVIQTIFSPMSQAKNLAGKELLLAHVKKYPQAVLEGLKAIHESNILFLMECKKLNIDGIFYAVQYGQKRFLNKTEFIGFEKQWAKELLTETRDLFLNVLHLHGENVYFEEIADLPVQVINWHDRQGDPDLARGKSIFPGIVCGGIRQWETLTFGTPADIETEILDAIRQTSGIRFILGTGCVAPIIAPIGNIRTVVETARSVSK